MVGLGLVSGGGVPVVGLVSVGAVVGGGAVVTVGPTSWGPVPGFASVSPGEPGGACASPFGTGGWRPGT